MAINNNFENYIDKYYCDWRLEVTIGAKCFDQLGKENEGAEPGNKVRSAKG